MTLRHALWTLVLSTPVLLAQENGAPRPGGPSSLGPPAPPPQAERSTESAWVDRTYMDLGLYYEDEKAVGTFHLANPHDTEHRLSHLQPSCACSKAVIRIGDRRYEIGADKILYRVSAEDGNEVRERVTHITVGPEEEGEIDVHMNMTGIRGPKDATLTFQTTDEAEPIVNLAWRATGATFFVVEPPDVNLNEMTWTDQRSFQFRITSPIQKDFEILSHEPLPEAMQISYEKHMEGDQAVWTVQGTYGPGASDRDNGGLLVFDTDVDGKKVSARVTAFLKGPLSLEPGGFVSLGHVRRGESKEVEVRLIPTGDFDLQVDELEPVRLRGAEGDQRQYLQFEQSKDGKDAVVTIRIAEGMEPTYVNGILRIHTNHPAAPSKDVMFNGFVR